MNTKTLILTAGVIGLFACMTFLPQIVSANEDGQAPQYHLKQGHKHKGQMQGLFEGLNLTEEQKAQLKAQREGFKGDRQELRQAIREKHMALKAVLGQQTIDRSKINAIKQELAQLNSQRIDAQVDKMVAVREILTPEQFQKFQEKKQSWSEKKKSRWDKE